MLMEMKRINENTIRVLLNNEDLNERGITVLDLLNHNQQIEDFFYSILEEVDAEHQFRDNDLVTFQVRPQQDGLELYITKTDPASLKKGTPAGQPPLDQDQITNLIKKELVGRDRQEPQTAHDQQTNSAAGDEPEEAIANPDIEKNVCVLRIDDFEDLVALAKLAQGNIYAVSDLYRYQDSDYLLLTFIDDGSLSSQQLKDQLALAYEYGQKTNLTPDVILEHGKPLMKQAALELVRTYFD